MGVVRLLFVSVYFSEALLDPCCFGSVVRFRDGERYRLLSVNCEHETKRENVVLKVSDDDGLTWSVKRTIDVERGGYCDIAVDEENKLIYVLYERKWGTYVFLCRMTADWLEV